MKQFLSALIIVMVLFFIAACKKENKISYFPRQTYLITTPIIPGTSDNPPIPLGQYAWGIMQTSVIDGNYTTSSGNTVSVHSNNAQAYFHGAKVLYVAASSVSINNYTLDTIPYLNSAYTGLPFYSDQFYTGTDSLSINNEDKWVVSASSDVPAISYDYNADLPMFTGTLPSSISISNGFSIKLDASNTANADSAIVAVYQENYYSDSYSNTISTSGGIANVPTSGLATASIGDANFNTFIEIILYKYTVRTLGNRQYIFAKVNKTIRSVSVTN